MNTTKAAEAAKTTADTMRERFVSVTSRLLDEDPGWHWSSRRSPWTRSGPPRRSTRTG